MSTKVPMRSRPWRELNREFWSKGQTAGYAGERLPARQLAWEKSIESMTLAELKRTQYSEPISESKRSYLQTGAGALSLEGLTERDARRYGTPPADVDPITQKQIAWEQRAYYSSPCVTVRMGTDGRITLDRFVDGQTFYNLSRRAAEYGMKPYSGKRYRRPWLTQEAWKEAKRRAWENSEGEIRRQQAYADPIWHSAYEDVTEEGDVVTVTAKRRTDTWHNRLSDPMELELGTDLCGDPELESLLGEDDLDESES